MLFFEAFMFCASTVLTRCKNWSISPSKNILYKIYRWANIYSVILLHIFCCCRCLSSIFDVSFDVDFRFDGNGEVGMFTRGLVCLILALKRGNKNKWRVEPKSGKKRGRKRERERESTQNGKTLKWKHSSVRFDIEQHRWKKIRREIESKTFDLTHIKSFCFQFAQIHIQYRAIVCLRAVTATYVHAVCFYSFHSLLLSFRTFIPMDLWCVCSFILQPSYMSRASSTCFAVQSQSTQTIESLLFVFAIHAHRALT